MLMLKLSALDSANGVEIVHEFRGMKADEEDLADGESIHRHFVETVSPEPLVTFWLLYAADTPPRRPYLCSG